LWKRGSTAAAGIELLKKGLERFPGQWEILRDLGDAHRRLSNDSRAIKETADNYYSQAILEVVKIRSKVTPAHIAILYFNRASLRHFLGRVEDAEKDADEGSVYDPNHGGIKKLLAEKVARHQEMLSVALIEAEEKAKQGLVYYHQKKSTLAEGLFTEAIALAPNNCLYLRYRTLANWELGLYEKVEGDCDEALNCEDENTLQRREMLYIRASARYEMKLYEGAEDDVQELLKDIDELAIVDSCKAKYETLLANVRAAMRVEGVEDLDFEDSKEDDRSYAFSRSAYDISEEEEMDILTYQLSRLHLRTHGVAAITPQEPLLGLNPNPNPNLNPNPI